MTVTKEGKEFSGQALNVAMPLYCDKHRGQAAVLRLNGIYLANAITSLAFQKCIEGIDKDNDNTELSQVVERLTALGDSKVPACCYIGQDAFDQILADAPPTTGDEHSDHEEAAYAIPGIRPMSDKDLNDMPEAERKAIFEASARLKKKKPKP